MISSPIRISKACQTEIFISWLFQQEDMTRSTKQVSHHSLGMTKVEVGSTSAKLSQVNDSEHNVRSRGAGNPQKATNDAAIQSDDRRVSLSITRKLKVLGHRSILCRSVSQTDAGS